MGFISAIVSYRLDLPASEWLLSLAESIHIPRILGPGVLAYELDISKRAGTGKLGMVEATGTIEAFSRNTEPLHRNISTGIYHKVLSNGTHCLTIRTRLTQLGSSISDYPVLEKMIYDSGAVDIWAVSTVNPDGRTLTFAIPLSSYYVPNRREAEQWRKIGIHIAAGYRLRRRISATQAAEDADAVVRPDGKVLHLTERAVSQRETSSREAQVATYVAQGHSYKVVAYEMGLSISTIGTHMRQVLRKLGIASPAELTWI